MYSLQRKRFNSELCGNCLQIFLYVWSMKVTLLGTGTSQGVPVIGCQCAVCTSADSRDNRLRCSVLIEYNSRSVVIDTGPDFRQQMLRYGVKALDAVLYTHEHRDHTAGLDDIRAFNYIQRKPIELYLSEHVEQALRNSFSYIFAEDKYPGIPEVQLNRISNIPFELFGEMIRPVEVFHYRLPVLGYRISDFCYVTDAKTITPGEKEKLRGAEVIVLNALRKEKHISHLTLDEALELIEDLKPGKAYLTHISHQMGRHADIAAQLPSNVELAYDGLSLEL